MLKKTMLVVTALAVSAAFLGAGSASAATLKKFVGKVGATVPVGTTFTATQPFWNGKEFPTPEQEWEESSEATLFNACMNASITFKVTQNSGGTFKAVPTAVTFPYCSVPQKWVSTYPGQELSVTGSSIANGTESAWLGTKFTFAWEAPAAGLHSVGAFTGATGSPPSKGVFVQQPTAANSPISLNLVKAPISAGSMDKVSAKFVLTGEAASYGFSAP